MSPPEAVARRAGMLALIATESSWARVATRLATMSPNGPNPMARPTPLSVVAVMRATVKPTTKPSSIPPIRVEPARICFFTSAAWG